MHFAESGKRGEQRVDRAFVYAQGELTPLKALQFRKPLLYLIPQVQQPFRVVFQQNACVGPPHRTRAAHKEWLAQGIFKFADAQADCWLGTVEAFGSTREAA